MSILLVTMTHCCVYASRSHTSLFDRDVQGFINPDGSVFLAPIGLDAGKLGIRSFLCQY